MKTQREHNHSTFSEVGPAERRSIVKPRRGRVVALAVVACTYLLAGADRVEAVTITTSNQQSIASSNSFPGTSGTHFHSSLGQPVEVGSYFTGEDSRGLAEFNLTGQFPSASATLSFNLTAFTGYYGQSGPGAYNISVIAYAGNNSITLSDYTVPSLATAGSFNTAGRSVGESFSFNVTSAFNSALSGNSLGIRLQSATNPGDHFANSFSNFKITSNPIPGPSSLPLTVPVVNAGNAPDSTGFGAVANNYRIGASEVTNAQYAQFLNAKAASDPLGLYNPLMDSDGRSGITRSGSSGSYTYDVKPNMGDKPVNYVSWYDSVRYANWMHNGQGAGDTESGAYTLLGGTATPTNGALVVRNDGAQWFLPTDDEWYKAAYYQPSADGGDGDNYWLYPTATNSTPTSATADVLGNINNFGPNVANYGVTADWNGNDGNVTTVGSAGPSSASYYGTYDQGGNVWEWNEPVWGTDRVLRGGSSIEPYGYMESTFRSGRSADNESYDVGFRIASVPEPSMFALAAIGAVGLVVVAGRRRSHPRQSGAIQYAKTLGLAVLAVLAVGTLSISSARAAYIFTNVADTTTAAPVGTFNSLGYPSLSGSKVAFFGDYNSGANFGIFTGSGGALTTIAKAGDASPIGTLDGFGDPALSGSTAAFLGVDNGLVNWGVFTGNGGALTTIAKTGDAAPVGTFSTFNGYVALSGSTAAFAGSYTGGASGIFTGSGGALTTIAKTGNAAPVGTFLNFGYPSLSGSTAAFVGYYNGGVSFGVFTGSGGPLTTIAKVGDAAPVGTFQTLGDPALSGSTAAFFGYYNSFSTAGIFTGSGGALTTIVKTGDAAPVGTFTSLGNPALSGNTAAFLGSYNGFANYGLFTGSGGALTSVILQGDSLFGSTVTDLGFERFGVDANRLAFGYILADGRRGVAVATQVPEPSSLLLAGLGVLGLALFARRRRARLALLALLPMALTADASAAYIFTNVADTTTAAPVGTFDTFGYPSLSGSTAAFFGEYNGGANSGIFTGSGGTLTAIAKVGDAAPVSTFYGLGYPALSGSKAAFFAVYNGIANEGVFTGSGGALTTITKKGDAAPVGTFSSFDAQVALSGSTAAFVGSYNGGANSGVFTGSGGALTTIVKTGDAAPVGTFSSLYAPAVSGSTAAFFGTYNGGFDFGIFTGSGGALTTIAKVGDAAPVGTFQTVSDPALSGSTAAFFGYYNSLANAGIFTGSGGALTTIVKTGDAAPLGTFDALGDPALSGNTAAFIGVYNGYANYGIFTGSGGALTSVILQGDSLFGSTVADLGFDHFGADANRLAFGYLLADGRRGIAVATVVPEPSSLLLAGLGILGLALFARRRRSK